MFEDQHDCSANPEYETDSVEAIDDVKAGEVVEPKAVRM